MVPYPERSTEAAEAAAEAGGGSADTDERPAMQISLTEPRGKRRARRLDELDYSNLDMPTVDIPNRFSGQRAYVQWFVHLDEYNTWKAFSRDVNSLLENGLILGAPESTIEVRWRVYTVNYAGMVQKSKDTGRLRHVIRVFMPQRMQGGLPGTGLPVEAEDE